jgi:hypothetical protein
LGGDGGWSLKIILSFPVFAAIFFLSNPGKTEELVSNYHLGNPKKNVNNSAYGIFCIQK